jgi:hypothetical protein
LTISPSVFCPFVRPNMTFIPIFHSIVFT